MPLNSSDRAVKLVAGFGALKVLLWAITATLLCLGLAANTVRMWSNHRADKRLWVEQTKTAAAQHLAQATAKIAGEAARDRKTIMDKLDGIEAKAGQERIVYRTAAAKRPLPANCAPGADRVRAVNAGADR